MFLRFLSEKDVFERYYKNHLAKRLLKQKVFRNKVGCVFLMVIWSEFRMGQYRHDDHREDAPHFIIISTPYSILVHTASFIILYMDHIIW